MVDLGVDLTFDAVESLVESDMNWAIFAEVIAGSGSFEIEDPVGSINTASEGNNNGLIFWGITDIPVDAITVIADNFGVLEFDCFAKLARPAFDHLLGFVSYGSEVSQSWG
jgi:hypothetical protein